MQLELQKTETQKEETQQAIYQRLLAYLGSCKSSNDLFSRDLAAIMYEIYRWERQFSHTDIFRFPTFLWRNLEYAAETPILKQLRRLQGGEHALSFKESCIIAGLHWRFSAIPRLLNDRLMQCIEAPSKLPIEALPPLVLFDLLVWLAFEYEWDSVSRAAKILAAHPKAPKNLRAQIADFLFLATFQHYKETADKGKVTKHVVSLEEITDLSARIVGIASRNHLVHRGVIACMQGNFVDGEKIFQAALEVPGCLIGMLKGGNTVFTEKEKMDAITQVERGETCADIEGADWRLNLRHAGANSHAYFVSCDEAYFKTFSPTFLTSLAYQDPDTIVHFNCVDFQLSEDELQTLEAQYSIKINTSYEVHLKTAHQKSYGPYIVSSRYVHLRKILPLYASVFLSDIDGVIVVPNKAVLESTGDGILLATMIELEGLKSQLPIWGNISGGVFGLKNISDHQFFADVAAHLMAKRIAEARLTGRVLFFSDQTMLAQLLISLQGRLPFSRMPVPFFRQSEIGKGSERDASKVTWAEDACKRMQAGEQIR